MSYIFSNFYKNFIVLILGCGIFALTQIIDNFYQVIVMSALLFATTIPFISTIFTKPILYDICNRTLLLVTFTYIISITGGIYSSFLVFLFLLPVTGVPHFLIHVRSSKLALGICMPLLIITGFFILDIQGQKFTNVLEKKNQIYIYYLITIMCLIRVYSLLSAHIEILANKERTASQNSYRFEYVINNSKIYLVSYNPENEEIVWMSNAALSYFNKELLSFKDKECKYDVNKKLLKEAFYEAITNKKSKLITLCFYDIDHEENIWLEGFATKLSGLSGSRYDEITFLFHDVTRRIIHESELKTAKEKAEEASKSKSTFLANMSHEFKTPLNAIIGFSDVMRNEVFGTIGHERYKEYIDAIYQSGSHLLDLISDLLDMSRIDIGRYELLLQYFNLNDLVKDCVTLTQLYASEKNISFKILNDLDLNIKADRRALKQILLNLISNSIKYCHKNSNIKINYGYEYEYIYIQVEDNGPGIEDNIISNIGTPFLAIKDAHIRSKGGSGLGLSIVKSLIDLHDGYLDIDTTIGEGTKFTVYIPNKLEITKKNLA